MINSTLLLVLLTALAVPAGAMPLVNSRADLDRLANEDPAAHADFITRLQAACTVEVDTAEYPEDYDHTLQPGDDGYIAPAIVQVEVSAPAERYNCTREELLALNPNL